MDKDQTSSDPLRLFWGVTFPADLLPGLQEMTRPGGSPLFRRDWRWTAPRNWHLTVLFLGNVPAGNAPPLLTEATRLLAGQKPFSLSGPRVGMAPNRQKPTMVWLEWNPSEALDALHQTLLSLTPNVKGERFGPPLRPHVTLARHRGENWPGRAEKKVVWPQWPENSLWQVQGVTLFSSEPEPRGVTYAPLGEAGFVEVV